MAVTTPPACLFYRPLQLRSAHGNQHRFIEGEGFRIRIAGRATMPTMAVDTVEMTRVPSLISAPARRDDSHSSV